MKAFARTKIIAIALVFLLCGCATIIPKDALLWQEQSLAWRQMQSRRFDTTDEMEILSASAALLQDLGFTISESEPALGLISSYKDRDASDAGQIVASVLIAALFGGSTPIDDVQRIKASVVTRPMGDSIVVRVTFQRVVWDTAKQISCIEKLNDPVDYQDFYNKLSKSIFLEANEI
jgi:hypothetical protein